MTHNISQSTDKVLWSHRTELLLGSERLQSLKESRVIIFGVGGVGSWCAEALIRSGIGNLTMVDSDEVSITNINRQLQALPELIGKSKVKQLQKRLSSINPSAEINAVEKFYDESTASDFDLSQYDYVLDAIDSLKSKILLIDNGIKSSSTVYSSMGAACKTDPSRIKTSLLSKTSYCPLARAVRRGLRDIRQYGDIFCVFSDEPAVENVGLESTDENGRKINGSLVHVTAPFGFALASLVIMDKKRPT